MTQRLRRYRVEVKVQEISLHHLPVKALHCRALLHTIREPKRFSDAATQTAHYANSTITIPIATSDNPIVSEALSATPAEVALLHKSIEEELAALPANGTWKLVSKGDG